MKSLKLLKEEVLAEGVEVEFGDGFIVSVKGDIIYAIENTTKGIMRRLTFLLDGRPVAHLFKKDGKFYASECVGAFPYALYPQVMKELERWG